MNITDSTTEHEMQEALTLAKAGQKEQALQILMAVVRRDPDQARAWMIMAKLMPDRQKAIHCLRQVLRIEPGNQVAAAHLAKIEGSEPIAAPPPASPIVEMVPIFAPPPTEAPIPQAPPQQDNSGVLIMAGGGIVIVGLCVLLALVARQIGARGAAAPADASPEPGSTSAPTAEQRSPGDQGLTVARQPNVTYNTVFYTIKGETVDAVRVDLQTKGPMHINGRDALAMAQIGYEVNWQQLSSGSDCSMVDVNVDVSITYTYPDWQPEGYVAANLMPEWDRFMTHVRAHEQHHGDLGVQCAQEMLSELRGVLQGVSCESAESVIDTYLDNKMLSCQAKQDAFDAVEGTTTFPLP